MLQVTTHEDVTQLRFTSWRSRLSRMRVSAFVVRGVLVDSRFPSVAPDLARWFDAHRVKGPAITHYHEDHSGGAAMLARRVLGADRLSRWYTGGDSAMENWVRGLRSRAPLA